VPLHLHGIEYVIRRRTVNICTVSPLI